MDEALGMGWEGPPFDMEALASVRGLRVERSYDLADNQDACVAVRRVLVNGRKPRVRQRSSVAHEVVHTIFPDYGAELERVGVLWRRAGDESELERLCQTGAAELLLPLPAFAPRLTRLGASLEAAVTLADIFDASIETTTRRVVEVSGEPLIMLMVRPCSRVGRFASGEDLGADSYAYDPRTPLVVAYACNNESSAAVEITAGTKLPPRSAAERAWKRVSLARHSIVIQCTIDEWTHVEGLGRYSCEAMTLPKGSMAPCEVICLLRLDKPRLSGTPSEAQSDHAEQHE
ncbi:MAG TPA: ImmA/IrrE family metallo-endopeptidase [Gemmatimonadaceae bacterium]|nr:ImmA/IrrE family metallo-endopeptidase [Gemmatimonadaceae bacterium]